MEAAMSYRAKVALVYLLGFSLDLVNRFVANVAYPEISHELQASVTQLAVFRLDTPAVLALLTPKQGEPS